MVTWLKTKGKGDNKHILSKHAQLHVRLSVSPLSRDEVDVVSQRGVIFGEFLRRSVISRILWFRRIRVHKGPETQEHAEEEGSDDGPGFQHDSHLENKTRVLFIYIKKCADFKTSE